MRRPYFSRSSSRSGSFVRVNGKIRAREVRVIGVDGKQIGVLSLGEAINLARANGVDLVEIAATANPPVCRLVDYGKFRYEQAKKDKESKKHQHATTVKEVQISPRIDPHDLVVKTHHAIDFLCEDMKVKVTLKFRGREMAHTEFGFGVIRKFLADIAPFGHPDFEPKLVGRGVTVMISPLPRNKRAKHPVYPEATAPTQNHQPSHAVPTELKPPHEPEHAESSGFVNNPFSQIEAQPGIIEGQAPLSI